MLVRCVWNMSEEAWVFNDFKTMRTVFFQHAKNSYQRPLSPLKNFPVRSLTSPLESRLSADHEAEAENGHPEVKMNHTWGWLIFKWIAVFSGENLSSVCLWREVQHCMISPDEQRLLSALFKRVSRETVYTDVIRNTKLIVQSFHGSFHAVFFQFSSHTHLVLIYYKKVVDMTPCPIDLESLWSKGLISEWNESRPK